jgi:hypothetical protein
MGKNALRYRSSRLAGRSLGPTRLGRLVLGQAIGSHPQVREPENSRGSRHGQVWVGKEQRGADAGKPAVNLLDVSLSIAGP